LKPRPNAPDLESELRFRIEPFCCLFLSLASLTPSFADDTPPTPADLIVSLVQKLGDTRFIKRETATKKLLALGEDALPALRQATRDDTADLEVRRRAESVASSILESLVKGRVSGIELRPIRAGDFLMGSPPKEARRQADEQQHRVAFIRPFLLGAFEVTQGEYAKLMNANPSYFQPDGEGKGKINKIETQRLPVEKVSWFDAIEFCNRLSKLDGFPPYYTMTDIKRSGASISAATVTIAGGNGYRLPTEAEWEYACRAGTASRFHYGPRTEAKDASMKVLLSFGLYGDPPRWHSLDRPEQVGKFKANDWGLYDMHGNVAEWCSDFYSPDTYTNAPATDPQGPKTGTQRVIRGGSWLVGEESCRAASRFWQVPGEGAYFLGFRVARTPK
jgi:formylglycine-generating enzyme required for sulfatase activity